MKNKNFNSIGYNYCQYVDCSLYLQTIFKNEIYVFTIGDVNNNINKTLKFTYVGSVKCMTINKFS